MMISIYRYWGTYDSEYLVSIIVDLGGATAYMDGGSNKEVYSEVENGSV